MSKSARHTGTQTDPAAPPSAESMEADPHDQWENLCTVPYFAQFIGAHPSTVRRWAREGKIEAYRIGEAGDWRIPVSFTNFGRAMSSYNRRFWTA